jgi:hypothetical protein
MNRVPTESDNEADILPEINFVIYHCSLKGYFGLLRPRA